MCMFMFMTYLCTCRVLAKWEWRNPKIGKRVKIDKMTVEMTKTIKNGIEFSHF